MSAIAAIAKASPRDPRLHHQPRPDPVRPAGGGTGAQIRTDWGNLTPAEARRSSLMPEAGELEFAALVLGPPRTRATLEPALARSRRAAAVRPCRCSSWRAISARRPAPADVAGRQRLRPLPACPHGRADARDRPDLTTPAATPQYDRRARAAAAARAALSCRCTDWPAAPARRPSPSTWRGSSRRVAGAKPPQVCLLDLDLQFGSVATYLDLPRREAVFELLTQTSSMDATAFYRRCAGRGAAARC